MPLNELIGQPRALELLRRFVANGRAPATLVFHGVTDLRINIDWGRSGFQCALHELSIDGIERQLIQDQKVYLDRPYYSWTIRLNWPSAGEITFGAVGFSQTLRTEPVLIEKQSFSRRERGRLTGQSS